MSHKRAVYPRPTQPTSEVNRLKPAVEDDSDSPFVLKDAGMMLGERPLDLHQAGPRGNAHLQSAALFLADTQIQLSADMVRVSAIALGYPRLAVIPGSQLRFKLRSSFSKKLPTRRARLRKVLQMPRSTK